MMFSINEWDPLEAIIVGSATHANWPALQIQCLLKKAKNHLDRDSGPCWTSFTMDSR
jgi:hypothetical protein